MKFIKFNLINKIKFNIRIILIKINIIKMISLRKDNNQQ